jgi:hypothetical protein
MWCLLVFPSSLCVCAAKLTQSKKTFSGKNFHFSFLQQDMRASTAYNKKYSAARPTCMMENMKVSIFCLHVDFKTFCVCLFLLEEKQKKALR